MICLLLSSVFIHFNFSKFPIPKSPTLCVYLFYKLTTKRELFVSNSDLIDELFILSRLTTAKPPSSFFRQLNRGHSVKDLKTIIFLLEELIIDIAQNYMTVDGDWNSSRSQMIYENLSECGLFVPNTFNYLFTAEFLYWMDGCLESFQWNR